MYHFFVRRHLREIVRRLNAGDHAFIRAQFHPDAEHWFAGTHALSGRRTSAARIADWYARLATVLAGIRFTVDAMTVSGPPWKTICAIEWRDEVFAPDGRPLPNQGVFVVQLRWGRAISFHVHCDTAAIEKNLAILAAQGVAEASADPITG